MSIFLISSLLIFLLCQEQLENMIFLHVMQAIAADGVVPFLGSFAHVSKNGEPRRALVATTLLCIVFAMIGSLNAVAPLVSICFLTCYSALNLSCLILSLVNAPR